MQFLTSSIKISYITTCLPAGSVDLHAEAAHYGEKEVNNIIAATQIKNVRVADADTTTADMCIAAAQKIISTANIDRNTIDGLVFVSQTPDHKMPATSFIIQHKLGLGKATACFDLPYGCSGYIYGLLQASLLIETGICKQVLVLAGDTSTRMINQKDRSVKMVFGDAGSATLVEKGEAQTGFIMKADGSGANQLIIPAGACRYPASDTSSIVTERENGNFRSDEDLYMDGIGIFNFAISEVPAAVRELLQVANWTMEETGVFALHQANGLIVDYLRRKMKLKKEQVPLAIENYGNTGPATIPLLFSELGDELRNTGQLNKVVMCGFGVGLSWGAMFTNLSDCTFIKPFDYER
jgi:3-oxoacyl-[acyl-carrier-protein] synthase-3